MSEHFNIQISVQKVEAPEPFVATVARRRTSEDEETPRGKRNTEVLSIKVTAEDESEAYAKARKMLEAATPDYLRISGAS